MEYGVFKKYLYRISEKKISKKLEFNFPETSVIIKAWQGMTLRERNDYNFIAQIYAQGGFYLFQRLMLEYVIASQLIQGVDRGEISQERFNMLYVGYSAEWIDSLDRGE